MGQSFEEGQPIFQQIAKRISDDIINRTLTDGDQVPSTNQFAHHYQINPATAAKGINLLVEKGILFKKRGIGIFVSEGARSILIDERREEFHKEFIVPMLKEAKQLELSSGDIKEMIERGENNEN
ncbi:GntR family transcriptional regulator [Evansella halocellulosilytica]|uniref:GntR family transcriptional regulator n=1 Tax=Evansella halocellulosilytica TaxID=2011013 RepID=UPI000BB97A0E|nr:GntR family transcriptional regulator [Evansella halocellulosilytica]